MAPVGYKFRIRNPPISSLYKNQMDLSAPFRQDYQLLYFRTAD